MERENKNKPLDPEKLILLRQILLRLKINIEKAIEILSPSSKDKDLETKEVSQGQIDASSLKEIKEEVILGVFDGQKMRADNGKFFIVPENYASKSKLVEGDRLKLIITPQGDFIYKQIGPVERERIRAILAFDGEDYFASNGEKKWRLLKASVHYFKGEVGDEVVILVPKEKQSQWAALENIIKRSA